MFRKSIKKISTYMEIRTKVTSMGAFLIALVFLLYEKQPIQIRVTIIFFLGMIMFDLTVTGISNYIDAKIDGSELVFKGNTPLKINVFFLMVSIGLGLYLFYLTDWMILFIGGLAFFTGLFYTFGPLAISKQPLGEIVSGLAYGFVIPFILVYINTPAGSYVTMDLTWETININLQIAPLLKICLLAVVPICATGKIMLANNICDIEKDVKVKRYTLPYYLGLQASLNLFASLYYIIYLDVIAMVLLGIIPPISIIMLFTIIIVQKNIKKFLNNQNKETTFNLAIKNYVIIVGSVTSLIFIDVIINHIL